MSTQTTHAGGDQLRRQLADLARRHTIIGWEKIEHRQHADLVITAVKAFGDDPRAAFYTEQRTGIGNVPRPDLILLHPDVGILVIENKGVELADIEAVQGTTLSLLRHGRFNWEDPFHQSEKVSFRLRDLVAKRCDLGEALFLHTAALPRISRGDFEKRFGVQWPAETFFSDACSSPSEFRAWALRFSAAKQQEAKRRSKLSKRANDAVRMILDSKSFLPSPRTVYVENVTPDLLGFQVQELELGLKSPTEQQQEYSRADMRGQHRLFRGVAGSGKSVLLALNAAQTVARYATETGDLFNPGGSRKRVLVVCFNRTLVYYLRQRVDDEYGRLTWDTPPETMLRVSHFERLVRQLEREEPLLSTGLTFQEKEERTRLLNEKIDALDEQARFKIGYDAIYLDEAQDLLPDEITFLLKLARKDENGQRTFIVFYDNAQNIFGITPPVWEKLGVNIVGGRTVFLDRCLRNTKETLSLAFNILVGSYAPGGQRVTTRTFADVGSLRQRGLVSEQDGRFEISFSPRSGPFPTVQTYRTRSEEIAGVAAEIKRLVIQQKVVPSDILVLYKSHYICKDALVPAMERALGTGHRVREVRSDDADSKARPLIEDGTLTISTIASAKGYDAPIVFLLGVDDLATDTKGRASFYVGATRAKLVLYLSGVSRPSQTLLEEVKKAARCLSPAINAAITTEPIKATANASRCCHCGGARLHIQYGKFGYFFVCIECTKNTPINSSCPKCRGKNRIRKEGQKFFSECDSCGTSSLVHINELLSELRQ